MSDLTCISCGGPPGQGLGVTLPRADKPAGPFCSYLCVAGFAVERATAVPTQCRGDCEPAALSVQEVAKRWHVSPWTVRRLIRDGELVPLKVAQRSTRVALDMVRAYERAHST